ncbi:hypothetical protein BH10ACT8_BH10ACT8_32800 [soil metagenome]
MTVKSPTILLLAGVTLTSLLLAGCGGAKKNV